MSDQAIVIRRELPSYLRAQAAAIFEEAFGDKLRAALPAPELRAAALEKAIVAERMVAAMRGDELLGIVGLSAADGDYSGGVIDAGSVIGELRALLGLVGGIRAVVGLSLGQYRPQRGELYIDGIAVASHARGHGVGTALLEEAASIGREEGFERLRLDVIGTNQGARRLYERLGYRVTKVQHFGLMRHIVGFSEMITMERPTAEAGSEDPEPS
jgi:ribosomal protein S18 acetylase RimI-like enzyme